MTHAGLPAVRSGPVWPIQIGTGTDLEKTRPAAFLDQRQTYSQVLQPCFKQPLCRNSSFSQKNS